MKKFRLLVLLTLVIQMIFGSLVVSANESVSKDIANHWAEETIQAWLDKGHINGYSDGSFKPNASITRAEFVKIINRAYYIQSSETSNAQSSQFTDLNENHWAYQEIKAAAEAGYVSGTSDGKVSPNAVITRQEAAVMLVRLTKLEAQAELTFKDAEQIPDWSKSAIEAMVGGGIMEGDPSGNFRAKDSLTRAEAVVLIDKLLKGLETAFVLAGEYGSDQERTTIYGDLHISAANVTLINTAVHGDLYIDEAVGEGDVFLKNVKVYGTTFVNGGGENSIHLEDSVFVQIIVDKATGKVRIVAAGTTNIEHVNIQSPAKLEESQLTDTGFNNVELSTALPAGSEVELIGHFENVHIMAASIGVKIPKGSINQLQVSEGATSNTIDVNKDAAIEKLVLDIVAKLIGEGTIKQAQLAPAAEKSSFDTKPNQIDYVDNSGSPAPTPTPEPELPGFPVGPVPQPNNPRSNDATIYNLTINEGLVLNKQEWVSDGSGSIEGFDSNHFNYTVDLPIIEDAIEITLNVQVENNATVAYQVSDPEDSSSYIQEIVSDNQLTVTVDATSQWQRGIYIYVTSESGTFTKGYGIKLLGGWDTPEQVFNLMKFKNDNYILSSSYVKSGDQLTLTIPAEHSLTGKQQVITKEVTSRYENGTYEHGSIALGNAFMPSSERGELGLKLVRDGEIFYDGIYSFDVTPVTYETVANPLESELFEFTFATKEQMEQWNQSNSYKFAYEYAIHVNKEAIQEQYTDAKYWTTVTQVNHVNPYPQVLIMDTIKPIRGYNSTNLRGLDGSFGGADFYEWKDGKTEYEVPVGHKVSVHLLNSDHELIKTLQLAFDIPAEFLEKHVVPKVILTEEELEEVPILLAGFNTSASPELVWTKKEYEGSEVTGFDPTHFSYRTTINETLIGQTLNLQFDTSKSFYMSLMIRESSATHNHYAHYSDFEIRDGIKLQIQDGKDYTIEVTVENPYSNETQTYSFVLLAERDFEEAFHLNKSSISSQVLQVGDILELIISEEDNSTSSEYTMTFTVESTYEMTIPFYLKGYVDPETEEQIDFNPSSYIGSVGIKLIRQGRAVYDGELGYDFTPLTKLSGATMQFYNDNEREAYINESNGDIDWDVVRIVDFSAIEGAAFIVRYIAINHQSVLAEGNLPVVTKQDLIGPAKFFTSLNDSKSYIFGTRFGFEEPVVSKYMYSIYIVYDANQQALGYAVLDGELSDEYVSDRVTVLDNVIIEN